MIFLVRLVTFSLTEVDKVKIYFCRKRIDTLATEKFHHPFQKLLRACKVHKIILLGGSRINFVPISPALIGNIYRSEEDLPLKAPYQDKTWRMKELSRLVDSAGTGSVNQCNHWHSSLPFFSWRRCWTCWQLLHQSKGMIFVLKFS